MGEIVYLSNLRNNWIVHNPVSVCVMLVLSEMDSYDDG